MARPRTGQDIDLLEKNKTTTVVGSFLEKCRKEIRRGNRLRFLFILTMENKKGRERGRGIVASKFIVKVEGFVCYMT